MLSKVLQFVVLGISVAPKILADVEGAKQKIGADTTLLQKIDDGLTTAIDVLASIAKVL